MIAALAVLLFGCASPLRSIERTDPGTQTDLSGRWNDTDSRLTAEAMIEDLLARPWRERFISREGDVPVVVVGEVRNLSSEHIQTDTFISDMERELINSGSVRFVAGEEVRKQIRKEKLDQQSQASEETLARLGEEIGADFMLRGSISSIEDAADGMKAVLYKITLELIRIETNEKVWIGDKEIKKIIDQRKFRW
ncbi:MAG: penicillin-binding protein activator LpoB [Spirochaetales bacterium]|nr:penicillin-binding protein activator LpoB [Spirochaetales bacterium]